MTSGVAAGDMVITDGGDRLRDGSPVMLPGDNPQAYQQAQAKFGRHRGGQSGQHRAGGRGGSGGSARAAEAGAAPRARRPRPPRRASAVARGPAAGARSGQRAVATPPPAAGPDVSAVMAVTVLPRRARPGRRAAGRRSRSGRIAARWPGRRPVSITGAGKASLGARPAASRWNGRLSLFGQCAVFKARRS